MQLKDGRMDGWTDGRMERLKDRQTLRETDINIQQLRHTHLNSFYK